MHFTSSHTARKHEIECGPKYELQPYGNSAEHTKMKKKNYNAFTNSYTLRLKNIKKKCTFQLKKVFGTTDFFVTATEVMHCSSDSKLNNFHAA